MDPTGGALTCARGAHHKPSDITNLSDATAERDFRAAWNQGFTLICVLFTTPHPSFRASEGEAATVTHSSQGPYELIPAVPQRSADAAARGRALAAGHFCKRQAGRVLLPTLLLGPDLPDMGGFGWRAPNFDFLHLHM